MYSGVFQIFARYWRAYGGAAAVCRSPYLHCALCLLAITFGTWAQPCWWDQVLGVLPNLLGFTLGGFAMFLGFGDEKFRGMLAEPDDEQPTASSVYVNLCATFVHFILVQSFALLFAVVAKSWAFYVEWPHQVREALPALNLVGGAVGYGLFLYAITSVLAATMHVFRIATWYEMHRRLDRADEA